MTFSRRKSNKHAGFMRNRLSEQEEQAPVYHQHTGTGRLECEKEAEMHSGYVKSAEGCDGNLNEPP